MPHDVTYDPRSYWIRNADFTSGLMVYALLLAAIGLSLC